VFLFTPLHEIRKLARPSLLKKILKLHRIDPLKTVHQAVTGFFSDQRLVQLFDRYATYNGSNPYTAPATLNIIPYVEFRLGGFYISGGMYRLVEALSKLALQSGVEIHTNTRVGKIRHLNSRVAGVSVNNEFIKADYILSGADVVETFSQLIDNFRKEAKKLEKLEPSLSGMVFLWGIDRQFPQLAHHNIFFSDDYRKEFAQIFNEKRVPDDPTVYISITSKTDSEHAPAGSENWFVLLNMPYLASAQNWEEEKNRMRNVILEKLYRHGLDVASHIVLEKVLTPEDFYHLYASNKGSIYGISSNSRLTAFRRPANRNRSIEGLYFAGGSAHPGGGIPLVLLSGKMAAELLADADKNENKNFKKSNLFNKNKSDFVKRENINSISMRRQTISIHQ
ncbi:MAG: phytoene desaturase, partial [Calditrichaeota bacterium]